jgi:hypothetical protein
MQARSVLEIVQNDKNEACTTDTHPKMFTCEGIAKVRKTHDRHLNSSPFDAQFRISHLQRIPWAAA